VSYVDPEGRLRDTIPLDLPYDDWVAEAYELFMPHDAPYFDDAYFRRAIERGGGTALELACGTGRLLLRWVQAGLDVEGIDASDDMLAICRARANEIGIEPVLHRGDIAPLALGRRFRTLLCPAGTFTLFHEREIAVDALRSWLAHLEPGGAVYLAMGVPYADFDANWEWRVRRSATRPSDGVTVMVHEAVKCDRERQWFDALMRYEWWDRDGRLIESRARRHRTRWWYTDEITRTLTDLGFVDVRTDGRSDGYIAVGHAPGA
jgi:SAM-dependent methyltransferase